jgi:hypothetical protein
MSMYKTGYPHTNGQASLSRTAELYTLLPPQFSWVGWVTTHPTELDHYGGNARMNRMDSGSRLWHSCQEKGGVYGLRCAD